MASASSPRFQSAGAPRRIAQISRSVSPAEVADREKAFNG